MKDYSTFWSAVPAKQRVRVARAVPTTTAAPTTTGTTPSYQAPTTYSRNLTSIPPTTTTTPAKIVSSTTPSVSTDRWNFPTQVIRPQSATFTVQITHFLNIIQAPPSTASKFPSVYEGCGNVKGCFAQFDSSCIGQGNCPGLVTYAVKGSRYEFELWAPNATSGSYIALALSFDDKMGEDSVTECTLVNGKVGAFMSYNDGKANNRLRDVTLLRHLLSLKTNFIVYRQQVD